MDKYQKHVRKKHKCPFFDRTFGSDWITCNHPDNSTALKICSYEHCPNDSLTLKTDKSPSTTVKPTKKHNPCQVGYVTDKQILKSIAKLVGKT